MTQIQTETGRLRADDDRCAVHFERLYDFTPAELWSAITDPDRLTRWLAKADVDPGAGGTVRLAFEDGVVEGRILTWDEPRVLEYEWRDSGEDESVVRFELLPQELGTRLVLDHRRLSRVAGTEYAAGWHAHLDVLAGLYELSDDAWKRRFGELMPEYRTQADELG